MGTRTALVPGSIIIVFKMDPAEFVDQAAVLVQKLVHTLRVILRVDRGPDGKPKVRPYNVTQGAPR